MNESGQGPATVAIVLVNWNGYRDTVACLESIRRLDYPNYSVIVVDNGSTDGSEETRLREKYPEHTVLQTGANLGFGGGSNLGIRHALRQNSDYVLLLNNDTEAMPGLITELVRTGESDTGIGIVSGKVYFSGAPGRVWSYGGLFNVNTGSARHLLKEGDERRGFNEPICLYLPACFWLLKRGCIESAGLLEEKYFHLAEDVEYCIRIQRKGWKLALAPGAVVHHKGSASMVHLSPVYRYYEQRNRLYVVKQYRQERRFLLQAANFCAIAARLCLALLPARSPRELVQNAVFVARAVKDFSAGRTGKRF